MGKIFKEVDEGEDGQEVLSDIDIQEYWENIKRTAQAENRIISQMIDAAENPKEDENYQDDVKKLLLYQEKEKTGEGENASEYDYNDDLHFHSPKNEFERMLHRKIFELNKLQADYHELQLQHQREKNLRLKSDETILKLKRQHASEKKNLALSVKNQIQDYFEKKVINIGLMYKKEINNLRKQFREVRMDLMAFEYLVGKLVTMFKDQELLLSYLRTRIRVNWKGEMSIYEVAGISEMTRLQTHIAELDEPDIRLELFELHQKYENLEQSYNMAKDLGETLTNDWEKAELRARKFEGLYKQEKQEHAEHVRTLMEQFKLREQELKEEQQEMNSNFDSYKQNIKKELQIKDAICERYQKYIHALKKELTIAKNVVKNPDLMRPALRSFNYTQLELYNYTKNRRNSHREKLNVTEMEKGFNKTKLNFVKRPITTDTGQVTLCMKPSLKKRLKGRVNSISIPSRTNYTAYASPKLRSRSTVTTTM